MSQPGVSAGPELPRMPRNKATRCLFVSLALALLLLVTSANAQTSALLWRSNWETPKPDPRSLNAVAQVFGAGCGSGCPNATLGVVQAAARTGTRGLKVVVFKGSPEASRVQMVTPVFLLSRGMSYTYCLWARSSSDELYGNRALNLDMMQAVTFATVQSLPIVVSRNWTQFCMGITELPTSFPTLNFNASSTSYLWSLNLAGSGDRIEFNFDDMTLTGRPNNLDATIMSKTAARIEQHRKGNFTLQFKGDRGVALPARMVTSFSLTQIKQSFPFGSAIQPDAINLLDPEMRPWFLDTTASMFNSIVPNSMFQWPEFEYAKGVFEDKQEMLLGPMYLGFAEQNGMIMQRGQALEWLTTDFGFGAHWSKQDGCEAYKGYLQTRVIRDVTAFKGKFQMYTVWNQLLHDRDWGDQCQLFSRTVKEAFWWAHAADPNATLCLNDFELIDGERWASMLQMVRQWQREGVPIHCIGIQAHLTPDLDPSVIQFRLDQLALTGLALHITELTLRTVSQPSPRFTGSEQQQADALVKYLSLFYSHPAVKGITLWGWWDTGHPVTNGGLVRTDQTMKPAALAVQQLWSNTWNTSITETNATIVLDADGGYAFRGFYGTYRYNVRLTTGQRLTGVVDFPMPRPLLAGVTPSQTVTLSFPTVTVRSPPRPPSPPSVA
ncbi:glycoside hydrolase superfamily [Haematococcus lacustris]